VPKDPRLPGGARNALDPMLGALQTMPEFPGAPRPRAAHVQDAIQAKAAAPRPKGRTPAAHVRAALGGVQAKCDAGPAVGQVAPHVQAALAHKPATPTRRSESVGPPPPLPIQRMQGGDEERRREERGKRFAPELARQDVERQAQLQERDRLRELVRVLRGGILEDRSIRVEASSGAFKHGCRDPAATFVDALRAASWVDIEAQHTGDDLCVTVRLGSGNTVTAVYTRFSGVAKVIHCGPIGGGVGYGTSLA